MLRQIRNLEKKQFKENGFALIKKFISYDLSRSMASKFIEYCQINKLSGDSMAPQSPAQYNYIPFCEILVEKTLEIKEIIGEHVFPTYSYARLYKKGAEIKKHKDRPSCEIAITLHLSGDFEWPIWIEKNNIKQHFDLSEGDAVIYNGDLFHGREAYGGEEYVQCFLFYVRSRGLYSKYRFDKIDENGNLKQAREHLKWTQES